MDLTIISLVIASVSALATIITALHLKHCKSACCESDCFRSSGMQTPLLTSPSGHQLPPVVLKQTS